MDGAGSRCCGGLAYVNSSGGFLASVLKTISMKGRFM